MVGEFRVIFFTIFYNHVNMVSIMAIDKKISGDPDIPQADSAGRPRYRCVDPRELDLNRRRNFGARQKAVRRDLIQILDGRPEKSSDPNYLFTAARLEIARRRFALAEGYLQRAIALDPANFFSRLTLAKLFFKSDRFDEALCILDHDSTRNHPYSKTLSAQIFSRTGRISEARSVLQAVLNDNPHDVRSRTVLGCLELQDGNLAEAIRCFRFILDCYPHDFIVRMLNLAVFI